MDLYPAIDLRGGQVVQLIQGDFDRERVHGDDPVAVAKAFVAAGAPWIHTVDLDAARTGEPVNRDLIAAIAAAVDVPVQAGGGVRSAEAAEALADAGVARVVIGTAALEDPDLVATDRGPPAGGARPRRAGPRGRGPGLGRGLGRRVARGARGGWPTPAPRPWSSPRSPSRACMGGADLGGLAEVLAATVARRHRLRRRRHARRPARPRRGRRPATAGSPAPSSAPRSTRAASTWPRRCAALA